MAVNQQRLTFWRNTHIHAYLIVSKFVSEFSKENLKKYILMNTTVIIEHTFSFILTPELGKVPEIGESLGIKSFQQNLRRGILLIHCLTAHLYLFGLTAQLNIHIFYVHE